MQRVETGFSNKCQRVVLLQKELASSIEGYAVLSQALDDIFRLLNNQAHCFVPGGLLKNAVLAYQRVRKSVFVMNCLPLYLH